MTKPRWRFDQARRQRRGGNASEYAFKRKLDEFVREVVQNAKDQSRDGEKVSVHFELDRLEGDHLKSFLDLLDWEHLETHLKAASTSSAHGKFLRSGLERLRSEESLQVLRIEDYGTGGLVGGEFENDTPFTSLCIDELFSNKPGENAGGSYGLGKSVLWSFSEFSTVLFSSIPEEYPDGMAGTRLFGRTQLPWHEIEDGGFDGAGWFGAKGEGQDGEPTSISMWLESEKDVLSRLALGSREGKRGTSILVVGFRPPTEDTDRVSDSDLKDRILTASAEWFWPLLTEGKDSLEITVGRSRNGSRQGAVESATVDRDRSLRPFTRILRARNRGETSEQLRALGDVVVAPISVELPARKDRTHGRLTAQCDLCVTLARTNERHIDDVAEFRGFGMVVRYRKLSKLGLSSRKFHACLLCGRARGDTEEDAAMEQFLRLAEPPDHKSWESTSRLRDNYKPGFLKCLQTLENDVKATLKKLIAQEAETSEDGPQLLSRLFPIGRTGPPPRTHQFSIHNRAAYLGPDDSWLFSAEVGKRGHPGRGWSIRVALGLYGDDGKTGPSVVASLATKPALESRIENGVGWIDVPDSIDKVKIQGTSDSQRQTVSSVKSAVALDIQARAMKEASDDGS